MFAVLGISIFIDPRYLLVPIISLVLANYSVSISRLKMHFFSRASKPSINVHFRASPMQLLTSTVAYAIKNILWIGSKRNKLCGSKRLPCNGKLDLGLFLSLPQAPGGNTPLDGFSD